MMREFDGDQLDSHGVMNTFLGKNLFEVSSFMFSSLGVVLECSFIMM